MRECQWCSAPVETTRGQAVCKECKRKPSKYADMTPEQKAKSISKVSEWRRKNPERARKMTNESRDRNRTHYTDYNREYKRKWREKRKAVGLPTQSEVKNDVKP